MTLKPAEPLIGSQARNGTLSMSENARTDVLVQRLHGLAVQHALTIKDMAQRCGVPKSSLEGYMRLKAAKRPGVDALVAIADAMGVSIDWLVDRSDSREVGEAERRRIAIAMFRFMVEILKDIEEAQADEAAPVVKDGKVGLRTIEDFAERVMLQFVIKERLFADLNFDSFRVIDELMDRSLD